MFLLFESVFTRADVNTDLLFMWVISVCGYSWIMSLADSLSRTTFLVNDILPLLYIALTSMPRAVSSSISAMSWEARAELNPWYATTVISVSVLFNALALKCYLLVWTLGCRCRNAWWHQLHIFSLLYRGIVRCKLIHESCLWCHIQGLGDGSNRK